jgi:Lon protease-like protein
MGTTAFHPRFDDLPAIVPIFPLPGALLLPHGLLPLNVFEPRYLAMVQDCLGQGRLIGMVQPSDCSDLDFGHEPEIFDTGCVGRVSTFAETDDGRIMITLTGVCRFKVTSEVEGIKGYRRVAVDWAPFRADLDEPEALMIDRPRLIAALKLFCKLHDMELNWKAIERAPDYELTVTLAMLCPFEPREKQALLESPDPTSRAEVLLALLEMAVVVRQGGLNQMRQ